MISKLLLQTFSIVLSAAAITGCASPAGKTTFPEPSASYAPKQTYAASHDKVWEAVISALEKNRIVATSTDKASAIIQTDYIAGQSAVYAGGFLGAQSTRYKYNITLRHQPEEKIKVIIICKIETADSGYAGSAGSAQWRDVTPENAKLAQKLENWLYEEIEKGL